MVTYMVDEGEMLVAKSTVIYEEALKLECYFCLWHAWLHYFVGGENIK